MCGLTTHLAKDCNGGNETGENEPNPEDNGTLTLGRYIDPKVSAEYEPVISTGKPEKVNTIKAKKRKIKF